MTYRIKEAIGTLAEMLPLRGGTLKFGEECARSMKAALLKEIRHMARECIWESDAIKLRGLADELEHFGDEE
jgi:hypothetical protein